MRTFGNILWLILGGLPAFLIYLAVGISMCLTIIGIPFGIKLIKIAMLVVWPFGTHVEGNFEAHPYLNFIWIAIGGLFIATFNFLLGVIACVTLIGIPFGIQLFKIAKYSIDPFGADYYPKN